MSSFLRNEKSLEEIDSIIDNFLANYEKLMGKKLENESLLAKLAELRSTKEKQLFDELFGTLHLKNINQAYEIVSQKEKPKSLVKQEIMSQKKQESFKRHFKD